MSNLVLLLINALLYGASRLGDDVNDDPNDDCYTTMFSIDEMIAVRVRENEAKDTFSCTCR